MGARNECVARTDFFFSGEYWKCGFWRFVFFLSPEDIIWIELLMTVFLIFWRLLHFRCCIFSFTSTCHVYKCKQISQQLLMILKSSLRLGYFSMLQVFGLRFSLVRRFTWLSGDNSFEKRIKGIADFLLAGCSFCHLLHPVV